MPPLQIQRSSSTLVQQPPVQAFLLGLLVAAATVFSISALAHSQEAVTDTSQACTIEGQTIASGLEHPWGLAFLDETTALVTERPGRMQVIDLVSGDQTQVDGVPEVVDRGQGGLLDVVAAPDVASTGTVYISFAEPRRGGATGTSIARAELTGWRDGSPSLADVTTLFQQSGPNREQRHFGSRIVVLPDETLAFTIGDRATPQRSQDPFDHAGSVLRIAADGSIPADNPFADGSDGAAEIWSTGHRNPQGAALDQVTGLLWTVEHGARGGDEINQPEAGRNYGWPTISYGVNYSGTRIGLGTRAEGLEQPVYYWDPSIAPSGMTIVHESALFPSWQGDMLVGALRDQMLVRLVRQGDTITGEDRLFEGAFGRIRDVRQGPDGAIWLLTDDPEGDLIRIAPQGDPC